jgi:transcriptional regulator with XRE-family HTH domain
MSSVCGVSCAADVTGGAIVPELKDLLRNARKVKGVTLRQVESKTGISNAYLSQLESGVVPEPSPHMLYKLAGYFGLSYASLMRAAGYVVPLQEGRPASNDFMFMGDKLTDEEGAAIAAFLEAMRDRTPSKKPK